MITERKEDIADIEIDSWIEKMLEKYTRAFLGDRFEEVADGENLYDETGRQPVSDSEGEQYQLRFAAGGEPGR
jgi:hypothetical protein